MPMPEERKELGYTEFQHEPYLVNSFVDGNAFQKAKAAILDADLVIYGSASRELYADRINSNSLIFKYSERIYKKKTKWYELPLRAIKYWWLEGRHQNIYLLCFARWLQIKNLFQI